MATLVVLVLNKKKKKLIPFHMYEVCILSCFVISIEAAVMENS